MKTIFRFLLLLFLIFTNTISLFAKWVQTNGPYGGSIKCFAVSGTNLFAGASVGYGGVYLSTNNGTSWTPVNSGLTNMTVNTLAVIGTNLFAGTGGGVFLSTNNGASWTQVNSGLTNTIVLSLAINPNGTGGTNLFAGTSYGGVFLSTNNGTSWTAVNSGLTNTVVKSLVVNGTNLFAGTSYGGVFLSTNNGTSWTPVNSGLTNMIVNAFTTSGTNLYTGTDAGVFLSTNNGTSWTSVNLGLSSNSINALAISPNETGGTNLFAGTSYGGVFLSTNNGINWTQVNSGPKNMTVTSLAVNPNGTGGANLFAGTLGGAFLSTNNGVSWTQVNSGLINTVIKTLAVNPNGTGGVNLFAGTVGPNNWEGTSYGGGVFLSTDNGTDWTPVNSGLSNVGVNALAVSPDGTGGTNLFAGTFVGVFISTNNGTSWTASGLTNTVITSLAISPNGTGGTNLFAGVLGGVFLSTDNGINWTPVSSGLTNTVVIALAVNPNGTGGTNLFVGTPGGDGIYLSTNNGTSWTAVNSGLTNTIVNAFAFNGTNIFAGTGGGGVFLSTNNGSNWTQVNSGLLPNTVVRSFNVSPASDGKGGTNIFAGTDGGIFLSTNNGTSWTAVNSGLLPNMTVNSIAVGGVNLFAGTSYGGTWKRTLMEMGNSLLSLTPSNIDQGTNRLGQQKRDAFTLSNIGTNTLNITSISSTNPIWRVSQTTMAINSDQSIIDTSIFTPSSFGIASGKIIITSDSPTSPDTITVKGNSPAPIITSQKSFITFGNVAKNLTRTDTVKIVNSTINTLIVDSIYSKTSAFVMNHVSGAVETDTLKILASFTPTAFANYVDTMYLHNNSLIPLLKIPLSGICPSPLLTVSKASITFSNRAKGDSALLTLYLKNMSVNTMTIISGTTATSTFAASVDSTIVAGLDSTALFVKFKPISYGTFRDTVTVVSDGGSVKISISGASPTPILTSLKSHVAFGNVGINKTQTDTLRIINGSVNTLIMDSIYTKTSAFIVDHTSGTVGTDTLKIVVSFTPKTIANYIDTLYLHNNSAAPLLKVQISGNSPAPAIVLSSPSISFGIVKKETTVFREISITNSSINLLSIDSLFTKTQYFTVGAISIPTLININDTLKITIIFKPDTVNEYQDTLYIINNSFLPIAKVPLNGGGTLTSVQTSLAGIPIQYDLSQNYPNPFNPSTTIRYALPKRSQLKIRIINLLGQVVAELMNTEQAAGYQSIIWNAKVTSGIYFYRIEATDLSNPNNRFVDTKKMILLK